MLRALAFLFPCALWIYLMRDFVFCRIPMNMDTNTIYGVTKFYFNNVLNGVIPLWEPFIALGRPFYAIAICNLFNPVTLLVPFLKLVGINYAQAFVMYMVVYFFIGCIGFYLLAQEILKDRKMAYLAYVGLMFSSLGPSMFTQLTFLEIVVPTIWFFLFLIRFACQQEKGNFLGLIFSSMVLISAYLPFYFLTVLLCFLTAFLALYSKEALQFCVHLWCFISKNWRIALFGLIGIVLAAAPLLAYKVLDASGDVVAPGRHCQYSSAQECYDRTMGLQGGMSSQEITRSGTLGERVDLQYLFGNLDRISYGSDSFFFLPVWIYAVFAMSFFLRINRLTVLLSSMGVLIGLIGAGGAAGLWGFLFQHVGFFAYFRNLFFLGAFLIPIAILFAVHQLQMLVGRGMSFSNGSVRNAKTSVKLLIMGTIFLHGAVFLFLRHFKGVPMISWVTLGASCLVFIVFYSGVTRWPMKAWTIIFAILMILQPAWILKSYAVNAREFAAILPSMHVTPVFSWRRPLQAAVDSSRIYQFVHYEDFWYDMSMTDAPPKVGYPQSVTRWTFDLSEHTPENVVANYAQYKIILYDDLNGVGRPVTGPNQEISVEYFDVNTLRLKVNFSKLQWVVYNDSYTTSWKAQLDGSPTELIRANGAFKAIQVPAGEHTIEFAYHPPGGTWVYITATGALFIFLLWTLYMLYWSKT